MKYKRILSGLLFAVVFSVIVGSVSAVSNADSYGDWLYQKNSGGIYLYGYNGYMTEITIPYMINGEEVKSLQINKGWDESNSNLDRIKKVEFESGYKKMPNTCLRGIKNVEELVIPEGVTEIESCAFGGLKSLKKVQFPSSLKKIGDNAFNNCSSLESITLPEGFETLEWGAFSGCTGLKSVTLPDSLKEMGANVFKNCTGLKDENGRVIVRDHLYYMEIAEGETEVIIPDGIKVLDGELFSGNKIIKKVIIPESVTTIQSSVFMKCGNLEEVILPAGIKEISGYAFYNCSALKNINVPKDTLLGNSTFRACKGLQDDKGFVIVNGIIYDYFGDENDLTIPDSVKEIGYYCFINKSITSVRMPDSLICIDDYAFAGCSGLNKIEVPDSVAIIGIAAFERCSSLSEVKLSKNVKVLDYNLFNQDTNLKELNIPDGVETIKGGAFKDSGIEEIILPASIKMIQDPQWNDDIKVIYSGSSEQWAQIEVDSLFVEPAGLVFAPPTPTAAAATETQVPTSTPAAQNVTVTPVPTAEVTSVPEVTVTPTVSPEAASAVTSTPSPEATVSATPAPEVSATPAVTVMATVTPASDTFKFKGNTYKIKGKNVTLIKGAKNAKVSIPATVKYLGKKYKVTAIGASAFKSNKKLKAVTIGKNVKSIGKKTFYGDSKLVSVTIKSKLLKSSKVGKNAFKGLSKSVVFKVPASKKKTYSKIVAKSLKKYKIK